MVCLFRLVCATLAATFRSRAALAAEILALRHQVVVLERSRPARLPLTRWDRALWGLLLRRWSGWKDSLVLVKPETVIAWHRRASHLFWRQRSLAGRPTTRAEIRRLIRQMAQENPIWGAPRIHGELLKLGYLLSERTVSRYLARIRPEPTKPRSQSWATFLTNHAREIVAADMFLVPTIRFQVLYIFIILDLERRRLISANVTANPTAEWLAQQVVNAFPWDTAPRFLIRDRDRAYGLAFSARVRGLGIREIRTAVRTPQMNAFAERVIGTLRRECFDHLIVLSERHAQRLLAQFRDWYNQDRVHLALGKDAPDHRPNQPAHLGNVVALPRLGGLHHRYSRHAA
jgi:putative transposase